MALALSLFVFRKKIVKELIEVSVSFILPSAHAQEGPGSINGSLELRPITSKFSTIVPRSGVLGLELQSKLGSIPELCTDMTGPFYMSAFILADINDENYYLKMNQCLKEDMADKQWVLNYGAIHIPLEAKEKKVIDEVWKKLGKTKFDFEMENLTLTQISKTLETMEPRQDLFAVIATVGMYSSLGNFGKVDLILKEFLSKSFMHKYFFLEYPYLNAPRLRREIVKMLSSAQEKLKSNKLFKAFLLKVYSESTEDFKDELEDSLNIPTGSKELASIYNSPNYGAKYPLVWVESALSSLKPSSLKSTLDTIEVDNNLDSLLVLRFYLPESKDRREEFYAKFLKLKKSDKPWHRALYFEILRNKDWLRFYSAKNKAGLNPFFKQKREFYRNNVLKNEGILFSIYNLYQMGDLQREYFLKLLAIRSYGLPSTQILPL